MSLIDRVRVWQDGVECRVHSIRPLSFSEYSLLLFVGFMVVGFVLMLLCFFNRVNPLSQPDLSSPVFYFGLSVCMLFCRMFYVIINK